MVIDPRWHWRGLWSGRLWARTLTQIEDWMLEAPAGFDRLIVLGASAGWMMSPIFLSRFKQVTCVDLEWSSRLFYRWRFHHVIERGGGRLDYLQGDVHQRLPRLLRSQPDALVLFDNLLGLDSRYTRDLDQTRARLGALKTMLTGRAWGSVHDRLSGPGPQWPLRPLGPVAHQAGEPLAEQSLIRLAGGGGEWLDHSTDGIFPTGTPTRLIAWPIVPGRWHWLEAAWVTALPPSSATMRASESATLPGGAPGSDGSD